MEDREIIDLYFSRDERAIRETGAKLLIIDPLQAFLTADTEFQKKGSFRNVIGRLGRAAESTGCAVVLIGHMNKNGSGPFRAALL